MYNALISVYVKTIVEDDFFITKLISDFERVNDKMNPGG